jgi:hypothetical protein
VTKASRKFQRIALKKARQAARAVLKGKTCSVPKCAKAAAVKHECLTCEKKGSEHVTYGCTQHKDTSLELAKRHALVKHPSNMLGAVGAALAGEDVF